MRNLKEGKKIKIGNRIKEEGVYKNDR